MATSYSQTFFPKLGTSKLNLLVSFMKNGSQELILLKKEFGSDFRIFRFIFAFPEMSPLTKFQLLKKE